MKTRKLSPTKKQRLFQKILMKRKQSVKREISNFTCIFINYYSILITVSVYCYLIIYRAKNKYLLPFHFTNNELNKIIY